MFFLQQYQRNEINLCLDVTIENTDSDLKVRVLHYVNELLVSVRLSVQKLLQTRLLCRKNSEKSNDAYSLSIRVQGTKKHISSCFFFYHNINVKGNVFSERELEKALRDTLMPAAWYLPQQISQSDCEISSNCGKKNDLSKIHCKHK